MNEKQNSSCGVVVLAAGQGKRMRSSLPKVLHELCGQPLLFHILDRIQEVLPQAPIAIVVGHGREQVEAAVRNAGQFKNLNISFVYQAEQRGTGHAARCAMESDWASQVEGTKRSVMVLPGDSPLLSTEIIKEMAEPLTGSTLLRLLTAEVADATGYGRVVRRGKKGAVLRIVEEKDATQREKEIREIAASIYTFRSNFLKVGLQRLSNKNAQNEYYLTDLVAQAAKKKAPVDVYTVADPTDVKGVNDLWELAQARKILNERQIKKWAKQGVCFIDPGSVWLDVQVEFEETARVHPGVILRGNTRIAAGVEIGPHVVLNNVRVGERAEIKTGTAADDSKIGAYAKLGPYAHLRPDSIVGEHAKIGNYVELKKATIGAHTSVAHLSYLGDADVGERVNIGCGFVTCNFDGRVIDGSRKHRTIIEDEVFLGSDCQAIAPIRIGKGAYIASGSTVTEDVEPGALVIARSRQVTKPGYAKRLMPKANS